MFPRCASPLFYLVILPRCVHRPVAGPGGPVNPSRPRGPVNPSGPGGPVNPVFPLVDLLGSPCGPEACQGESQNSLLAAY